MRVQQRPAWQHVAGSCSCVPSRQFRFVGQSVRARIELPAESVLRCMYAEIICHWARSIARRMAQRVPRRILGRVWRLLSRCSALCSHDTLPRPRLATSERLAHKLVPVRAGRPGALKRPPLPLVRVRRADWYHHELELGDPDRRGNVGAQA
eukprot:6202739-Pleurochrysis_carterae.AAC.1